MERSAGEGEADGEDVAGGVAVLGAGGVSATEEFVGELRNGVWRTDIFDAWNLEYV